jgi:hypothetical protein
MKYWLERSYSKTVKKSWYRPWKDEDLDEMLPRYTLVKTSWLYQPRNKHIWVT